MKLLQVAEQNKPYYSADYTKGFNDGAKAQYEADRKDAERRGRWITKGQDIFCSVCGEESAYTWCGASKFSNYCPNCGALMTDEVEE